MIIGNGDIAKVLWEVDKDENIIFFASGVSDSKCDDEDKFEREKTLLKSQDREKHLVYFSSLAPHYNPNSAYSKHKIKMEALIARTFKTFTIYRIGNITWGDNPNTIINYFKNQIKNNMPLDIQQGNRWLITKEELLQACGEIKPGNRETIILRGRMIKISDIVQEIKQGKL